MENDMKKERLIGKLGSRLEIMTNRVNRAAISIRCRNGRLIAAGGRLAHGACASDNVADNPVVPHNENQPFGCHSKI